MCRRSAEVGEASALPTPTPVHLLFGVALDFDTLGVWCWWGEYLVARLWRIKGLRWSCRMLVVNPSFGSVSGDGVGLRDVNNLRRFDI